MRLYDFWKEHKAFILFVLAVFLFFFVFLVNNHIEMLQTKKDYETQIEELKNLVQVTNLGEAPEIEFDIYQTAEDFLSLYYGVSKEISTDYRAGKLKELMTEDAYSQYGDADYDNELNYTITLADIQTYVDYKNSSREGVLVCVFYDENIDWPGINTITLKKYWLGTFVFDYTSEKWLLNDITDCQELLTREEFNALNVDTNGSTLEDITVEGDDGNADTEGKE